VESLGDEHVGESTINDQVAIRYSATVLTNVYATNHHLWPQRFGQIFAKFHLALVSRDNFRGSSLSSSLVSPSHPLINYVRLWNGHPDLFRNCWFGIMVSKIWLKSVHERAHSHSSIKEFMMPVDILCSGRFSLLTRVCEIHKNG
jgi:hypothetical protein